MTNRLDENLKAVFAVGSYFHFGCFCKRCDFVHRTIQQKAKYKSFATDYLFNNWFSFH